MAIFHRLTLLIMVTLLGACSSQYAYRLADWWLENQIEDYLQLNKEQRQRLSQAIDGWHLWHQQQELPRYQRLLNELQNTLGQEQISVAQITAFEQQAQAAWQRLLQQGGPLLAELVLAQSPKQREYLYKKIAQSNEELQENFADRSEQERRQRAAKNMSKQLREYLGKLNRPQQQAITAWAERLKLGGEIELAERLHWQQRFRDIIEGPKHPQQTAQLLAHFANPEANWTKDKRQLRAVNRPLQYQLIADVYRLSSEQQKQRLAQKIRKYQTLLDKMSQQKL